MVQEVQLKRIGLIYQRLQGFVKSRKAY